MSSFKYVEDPILGKGRAEFENGGSEPRAIRRDVQLEDEAQACVGWGTWDNAENIDYYPINSVFTVNSETKALVSVSPYNTPVAPLS